MKTPKLPLRQKRQQIIIIISILILITIVIFVVFLFINKSTNHNPNNADSKNNSETINTSKTTTVKSEGLPSNTTTTTSEQVPINDSLSVTIDSFTQINGMVNAIASTSNNGTCVFTYKPADGGKPVTRQTSITDKTCTSSISENEFTYIGDWSLTVTYYNNSQKIEVQKNVTIS